MQRLSLASVSIDFSQCYLCSLRKNSLSACLLWSAAALEEVVSQYLGHADCWIARWETDVILM